MRCAFIALLVLATYAAAQPVASCGVVRNGLIVEVYFGGAGPYPMVFDLAAERHELDPEVAAFLKARGSGAALEAPEPMQSVEAGVTIGGVSAGSHRFVLRSMKPLLHALGRPIAGKLGGQALEGALTLDLAAGLAGFDPEPGRPVDPYTLALTDPATPAFAVEGKYDGEPITLDIDTTLAAVLALPADRANLPDEAPRLQLNEAKGMQGSLQTRGKPLRVARTAVPEPIVSIAPAGSRARLGLDFLRQHRVTFGLPRAYLRLEPLQPGPIESPAPVSCGMVLTTALGTGWFVAVAPGSPAAAAGLRTGDIVVAANGKSLAGKDFAAANALLEVAPGTPLLLLMRRGLDTAPFELTVHSLL